MNVLIVWAGMLAFDLGRYLLVCAPVFLIFHALWRDRWRHRWIQRGLPGARKMWREVRWSMSTAIIFSLVGTGEYFGARAGIFRVTHGAPDASALGWAYVAASVLLLLVLQDTYFYFTHRAMHHPRLYKIMHRVHHLSTNPSPWAAYSFAPGEALVHAAFVPLVTLVLPVHDVALFAFLAIMILRNAQGHLGLELFPRGFAKSRVFGWLSTTTHHDMHHQHFRANFGLYSTFWDRRLGTTHPDYVATFERVTGRDAKARV